MQASRRIKKRARPKLGLPIAIMLDTKGSEYRIRTFEGRQDHTRTAGEHLHLYDRAGRPGGDERVSVSYPGLARDLEAGDTVLVNDGLIALTVTATTDTDVICRVTAGGVLSDRKSMSFPNKVLKQVLPERAGQTATLLFGIENDVDFVACVLRARASRIWPTSMPSCAPTAASDISVIAKIENQPGIDNIEEIFAECDGIMIARGDMGVEIPYEELPGIQKELITKCRHARQARHHRHRDARVA